MTYDVEVSARGYTSYYRWFKDHMIYDVAHYYDQPTCISTFKFKNEEDQVLFALRWA